MEAVHIGERTIPHSSHRLGRMRPTDCSAITDAELSRRLEQDGYLYLPKLIPREAVLAGQVHITAGIQCRRQCRCRSAASPSQTQCGRRFDGTEERVSADFFKNSIETAGLEAASSGPIFDHARGCGTAPCLVFPLPPRLRQCLSVRNSRERALLPEESHPRTQPPTGWLQVEPNLAVSAGELCSPVALSSRRSDLGMRARLCVCAGER